jgi:hypothetical protein
MAGGSSAEQLLSRIASGDGHGENSSYFDGWKAYDMDPFDLRHNRDGVIQMGLAENQVRDVALPHAATATPFRPAQQPRRRHPDGPAVDGMLM